MAPTAPIATLPLQMMERIDDAVQRSGERMIMTAGVTLARGVSAQAIIEKIAESNQKSVAAQLEIAETHCRAKIHFAAWKRDYVWMERGAIVDIIERMREGELPTSYMLRSHVKMGTIPCERNRVCTFCFPLLLTFFF